SSTTWGSSWTSPTAWPCSTSGRRSRRGRRSKCRGTRWWSRRTSARISRWRTVADAGGDRGTLPRLLASQGARLGSQIALREKQFGIWQQVTWAEYAAHVRAVCLGLVALGLERGDRVAVICGNRPAWLYTELAVQAAGAVPLGIFVD